MKRLLFAILSLTLIATLVGGAQDGKPPVTTVPKLKTEDLLKIKDLQFRQARRVIRRLELEREYEALQKAIAEGAQSLAGAADMAMANANVDRSKWELNGETLELVARPSPTPSPGK